jgi:hypothetical protein
VYTNLECQIAGATGLFLTVAPNIRGSPVRILLHVAFLAPRILRWLLDSWKICAPWSKRNLKRIIYDFSQLFGIIIDLLLTRIFNSENNWQTVVN